MMKAWIRTVVVIMSLTVAVLASAMTLDDAKNKGLVGEQPNGYLGIVGKSTPELVTLVSDINQRRKVIYQQIADKNQTELRAVEELAGKKAIEKTPAGQYVRLPSGEWHQVR